MYRVINGYRGFVSRRYHIYCVGLRKVPSGSWQCQECTNVADSMNNANNIPSAGGAVSAASVIAASVQAAAVPSTALASAVAAIASVAMETASTFKEPGAVATPVEPMQEG